MATSQLPALLVTDSIVDATTTVAALHPSTRENGDGWYMHRIVPGDRTSYFRVCGPEWRPMARDAGRWFGNFQPRNQREARAYYNLTEENPATFLYEFRFNVPERLSTFCIFGSTEVKVGHWQAKFPAALIEHIELLGPPIELAAAQR